jgi:hypothetical protein
LIPFGGCKPCQDDKVLLKANTLPLSFWEATGVGKEVWSGVQTVTDPVSCHLDGFKNDVQHLYDMFGGLVIKLPTNGRYHHIYYHMCGQDPQYENYMAESQSESLAAENWSTAASVAPQDQSVVEKTYQPFAESEINF